MMSRFMNVLAQLRGKLAAEKPGPIGTAVFRIDLDRWKVGMPDQAQDGDLWRVSVDRGGGTTSHQVGSDAIGALVGLLAYVGGGQAMLGDALMTPLLCAECDAPIPAGKGLCLSATGDARYCGRPCAMRAHARDQRTNEVTPDQPVSNLALAAMLAEVFQAWRREFNRGDGIHAGDVSIYEKTLQYLREYWPSIYTASEQRGARSTEDSTTARCVAFVRTLAMRDHADGCHAPCAPCTCLVGPAVATGVLRLDLDTPGERAGTAPSARTCECCGELGHDESCAADIELRALRAEVALLRGKTPRAAGPSATALGRLSADVESIRAEWLERAKNIPQPEDCPDCATMRRQVGIAAMKALAAEADAEGDRADLRALARHVLDSEPFSDTAIRAVARRAIERGKHR